jgi:hypothetical protein
LERDELGDEHDGQPTRVHSRDARRRRDTRAVAGAIEHLAASYWLATVSPEGRPHVRPILAVWVEGRLYFCASERTRKAKNLVHSSECALTVELEPLDLVLMEANSRMPWFFEGEGFHLEFLMRSAIDHFDGVTAGI